MLKNLYPYLLSLPILVSCDADKATQSQTVSELDTANRLEFYQSTLANCALTSHKKTFIDNFKTISDKSHFVSRFLTEDKNGVHTQLVEAALIRNNTFNDTLAVMFYEILDYPRDNIREETVSATLFNKDESSAETLELMQQSNLITKEIIQPANCIWAPSVYN